MAKRSKVKPDIRISEYCEKHESNTIEGWCTVHGVGVCTDCQKIDHLNCKEIESLTESRSTSELNTDFKRLKRKFKNISDIYKQLVRERGSNIESLKLQKATITDQIRNLRENINNHLTELEKKLIDELERKCAQFKMKLDNEVTEYKYRNAVLERFQCDSARAKEYGSDLQIVLAVKEGNKMTDTEEIHIKSLNGIIKNFSVELKIMDLVTGILSFSSMGSINTIEANAYVDIDILKKQNSFLPKLQKEKSKVILVNKEEPRWDRTRLKRDKEFNMNTSLNKFLPEVSGAVFLADESIILADAAHKRLLHFKTQGPKFEEIPLSFIPFDVAVLGNSKLYISVANDRRLEVRDIGSMKQIDELILPSNVSGINGYEDSILVVVCEKTGLYLLGNDNSVNIIAMRNNEGGPVDICSERICYAETKKCMVHSFTHDGKKKFSVKIDGFGYIHGIALLTDCSVLVAKLSPGKHTIFHISEDGKEQMLRLELNEISAPRSFAVQRKKHKLLLVHGVRKISIFKENI